MNKLIVVRVVLGLAVVLALGLTVTVPATPHAVASALVPLSSGGGCNSYYSYQAPTFARPCISESYGYIYPDSYVGPWYPLNPNQWQGCNLVVKLYAVYRDSNIPTYMSGRQFNCLSEFIAGHTDHWSGWPYNPGGCTTYYAFYTQTELSTTYAGTFVREVHQSPKVYIC